MSSTGPSDYVRAETIHFVAKGDAISLQANRSRILKNAGIEDAENSPEPTTPPSPVLPTEVQADDMLLIVTGAGGIQNVNPAQDREGWLNGWHRNGVSVLIGTGVYCAGCGKFNGLACVAIDPDSKWPEKRPDWPFNEADCPLCLWRDDPPAPRDLLTERAERLAKARGEKK